MAGDAETGVCIMQMEAGLDTGPVLMREATAIGANETTADLHERLAEIGAALIVKTVGQLPALTAEPQSEHGVTYAAKIDKAEAAIDWAKDAVEVDRKIRGLSPFPGAWFERDGTRIKVLGSELANGTRRGRHDSGRWPDNRLRSGRRTSDPLATGRQRRAGYRNLPARRSAAQGNPIVGERRPCFPP